MTTPHTPESDRALIKRMLDALDMLLHDQTPWTVSNAREATAQATARLAASDRPDALSDLADEIEATYPTADATNLREFGKTTPPAEAAKVGELPELPECADAMALAAWGPKPDYYTADQMHDYARAAIAALQQPCNIQNGWRVQRNSDGSIGIFAPPPKDGESRRTSHAIYPSDRSDLGELMFKFFTHTLDATPPQPSPSADVRQRARELLAAEYERLGLTEAVRAIRSGSHLFNIEEAALCVIESALAQPQQAGGQAVAYDGLTEEFADEVARIANDPPGIHDAVRSALASCEASIVPIAAPTLPDVSEAEGLLRRAMDVCLEVVKRGPHAAGNAANLRNSIDVFLQRRATLLGEVKP